MNPLSRRPGQKIEAVRLLQSSGIAVRRVMLSGLNVHGRAARTPMAQRKQLTDAAREAESELRSELGLFAPTTASGTSLNITGADDANNAYLLRLSCVLAQAAASAASTPSEVDAKLQQPLNQAESQPLPSARLSATHAGRGLHLRTCFGKHRAPFCELFAATLSD
jgi:hypothetical protein